MLGSPLSGRRRQINKNYIKQEIAPWFIGHQEAYHIWHIMHHRVVEEGDRQSRKGTTPMVDSMAARWLQSSKLMCDG